MNTSRLSLASLDNTIFFSLSSNYVYYSVAKNACTLIKALLYQLEYRKSCVPKYYHSFDSIHDLPPSVLVRPSQLSTSLYSNFLNDKSFRDLIILRDPRKRLISAIRDKLTIHSPLRASIFYRAGLSYDKDLILTDKIIRKLHQGMHDLVIDIHFLPQFTVYSMIERPNPVVLALGMDDFTTRLENFLAYQYGISFSVDNFVKENPWTVGHSTIRGENQYECAIIDELVNTYYPMDILLWNQVVTNNHI